MPFYKTDDLQAWTGGTWTNLGADKKPDIHGFSNDSRNMEKDFAFVALKGERDGHDFAANAVENGAKAVIAEHEIEGLDVPVLVVKDSLKALQQIAKFHRLRYENPVVAITGSCGKTSTKEMLAQLLAWKTPLVTEKNYNNEIGVPLTLTRIDLRQNQAAIIEAGVAAPGQMKELAQMIEPDIAIVTNVGLTHLENFIEVANVAKEKAVLPAHVAQGGWCVLHNNLLSWKSFSDLPCKKAVVAHADAPEVKADLVFRYTLRDEGDDMVAIDMCIEGGDEFYFRVRRMSAGMLDNALLAVAASLMLGSKEEQVALKLEAFAPLPMRGGVVETEKSKFYVDCYNASPTSMKDALSYFAKISADAERRMFVLGSMAELGLANHRHHKEIGSTLPHRDGDKAVLVGPNADIYKAGMLEGGWPEDAISVLENSQDAKALLESFEGFAFVKGSRVCELEKALPAEILEKLSITTSIEVEEEPEEEDEPESTAPEQEDDSDDGDEFAEEEFSDEEIGDDEDDEIENIEEEESEDDRETI